MLNVTASGSPGKPLTIRNVPGELAVVDGGLREFHDSPATAWEPAPGGPRGEFRSVKTYSELGPMVCGHFADSLIPLHAYRNLIDLRSVNGYWTIKSKLDANENVYCGPGLWFDAKSERLHCRLAPTDLDVLGDDKYRGEADPRRLSLCVCGPKPTLRIVGARHLRFRDLVIRGSTSSTVSLDGAQDVTLDGVTIYGGSPALWARSTVKLTIVRSALRGIASPWSTRAYHNIAVSRPTC